MRLRTKTITVTAPTYIKVSPSGKGMGAVIKPNPSAIK